MAVGPPLTGILASDALHTHLTETRAFPIAVVYTIEVLLALIILIPVRGLLLCRDLIWYCRTAHHRWRAVVFHVLMYPLDFIVVAIRVVLLVTVYRAERVQRLLDTTTRGFLRTFDPDGEDGQQPPPPISKRLDSHVLVCRELPGLLLDLPCAVLGLVVLLSGWRTAHYVREFRALQDTVPGSDDAIPKRRRLTLYHFGNVWLDLPFMLCAVLVGCSLYRLPAIARKLHGEPILNNRRMVAARELFELVLDLPFIALGLVVCAMPNRVLFLLRDVLSHFMLRTAVERRRAVVEQLVLGLLDVPVLASFCLLFVTSYRYLRAWEDLNEPHVHGFWAKLPPPVGADQPADVAHPHASAPGVAVEPLPGTPHAAANAPLLPPAAAAPASSSAAAPVTAPTVAVLPAAAAAAPAARAARSPSLTRRGCGADCCCHTERFESHLIVLQHFFQLFVDVPCVLAGMIVVVSGWRTPAFVREMRAEQGPDSMGKRRLLCLTHFVNLLIDLPFSTFADSIG